MRFELTRRAGNDLKRVFEFNRSRSDEWAIKVQNRLLARAQALTTGPRVGRPFLEAGVFRLSVTDIQYVIDYRRGPDFIRILRFRHTREIR